MNSAASENEKNKAPSDEAESGERLQKLMAKAGLGSRRACEEIIAEGRVSINGHIISELGTRADLSRDRIVVDGKPLTLPTGPSVVVMLHKPRGVITTRNDPERRSTVMELLPRKWENLHPIGRLDFDTSGLLLLTDDGELTQLLTHPSHGVEKTYQARVRGQVKGATVRLLQDGVRLEDGVTAPCRVRVRAQTQNNALVEVTLREGKNRQVRRMLEAVGHQVSSLRRIKFGPIEIEGVVIGTYRQLLPGEVHMLRKAATTKTKVAKAKNAAPRARKLSPASPISADERARRKEVVRSAKYAKSSARAAAYRAANASGTDAPTPPTECPISRPAARSNSRPSARPPERSNSRPASRSTSRPTPRPSARPTERPTSRPTERPTSRSTERSTSRPTERSNSRPATRPTSRATSAANRDTAGGTGNARGQNANPRGRNAVNAPDSRNARERNEGEKSAVAKRIQKRWQ